ncbi:DUF4937 domain-containing protein [Kitasatospora sp. NPDC048239]|uniref:DUF4937 domain-containing protein n=1 Tax=Kitasatospora sp. NPDC048239 TaxID=3364046 RepID=UPI00371AF102
MWGKWISCGVPTAARGVFSAGQSAWSVIGDQPGLVGQVGGWDPATGRAHVLGMWADARMYRRFMDERHDAVVAGIRQDAGYRSIEIAAGGTVLEMAGDAADLPQALKSATLLRVADCRLLPGREDHFLEVQREVWAPGMAAAGGMLAGVVTQLARSRCLVTSLWTGPAAHRHYADHHLPGLRSRAALGGDLQAMAGHVLPLEEAWRVLPEPSPVEGGR